MPASMPRLRAEDLANDEAAIIAIKNMEGYLPGPGLPSIEDLMAMTTNVRSHTEAYQVAQNEALIAQNSVTSARNDLIQAENERHEAVMRLKAYVIAQYGRDSNEVRAVGLKRKSDRKRPTRRKSNNGGGE